MSNNDLNRRDFVKATAATGAAAMAGVATGIPAIAAEGKKATSETLVQQLHSTLSEEQKAKCTFPFDHELRSAINNN